MGRPPKPESLQAAYERGQSEGYRRGVRETQQRLEAQQTGRSQFERFRWHEQGYAEGIKHAVETADNILSEGDMSIAELLSQRLIGEGTNGSLTPHESAG